MDVFDKCYIVVLYAIWLYKETRAMDGIWILLAAFLAIGALFLRQICSKDRQVLGPHGSSTASRGKPTEVGSGEPARPTYASLEPSYRGLRVLVVDDYQTMRRVMSVQLMQIGFGYVDTAADGAEALSKLRSMNFDLVVSDWNMSPMTGLQLLQQIRADDKLKHIPFIMVSAEDEIDMMLAARQAGSSAYLLKPFTVEALKEKIGSALNKK